MIKYAKKDVSTTKNAVIRVSDSWRGIVFT